MPRVLEKYNMKDLGSARAIQTLIQENENLKNTIPKAHISTTSIQLTDSAEGLAIENVKLKGQTSQETTTGKNLLDYVTNLKTSYNGLTSVINSDGSITTTGIPTQDYVSIIVYNINSVLENGQTYVLSQENAQNRILYLQINGTPKSTGSTQYISLQDNNVASFTADTENYNYTVYLQTRLTSDWGSSSRTITNYYMLEKNSTKTDFEKYTDGQPSPSLTYKSDIHRATGNCNTNFSNEDETTEQNAPLTLGNTELYEDDEIEIDYVQKAGYKKVTGARLVQNIGKYIFNGTETFNKNSGDTSNTLFYITNVIQFDLANGNNSKCNYLTQKTLATLNVNNEEGFFCNTTSSNYVIYINIKTELNTGASVQAKLKELYDNNTPMCFVYPLETPTTTPITDPTLLAQFETLINMKTYKDITNIDCTGEDLAPVLDCDYYQDMSTLNDRLDTLEARIELLEN